MNSNFGDVASKNISEILMAKKTPVLQFYLQRPASLVLIVLIILTVIVPAVQALLRVIKARKAQG